MNLWKCVTKCRGVNESNYWYVILARLVKYSGMTRKNRAELELELFDLI